MLDRSAQALVDRARAEHGKDADAFGAAVDWEHSGWPAFALYRPLFDAVLGASLPIAAGGIDRKAAMRIASDGIAAFDPDLAREVAAEQPLPPEQQAALREEMREAHCGMLPESMLDGMALIQRARDAQLALAMRAAGGQGALLIAGAGHVRSDRGVAGVPGARRRRRDAGDRPDRGARGMASARAIRRRFRQRAAAVRLRLVHAARERRRSLRRVARSPGRVIVGSRGAGSPLAAQSAILYRPPRRRFAALRRPRRRFAPKMSQHKNLPLGRLGRLARMAQVGMRSGASMLLSRDGSGAADQAAEILGNMRGLAAKIGQMASYVDGLVPEAQRDSYEQALRGLRAAAPTSSPVAIRAVVESELGAPIERLFAEWDDTPIASASIGQVHRARIEGGREVAVKVQHPGIERAIETDLKNASVVEGLVAALGPRSVNSKEVFDEIAERFREELDYQLEAERQRASSRCTRGDAAHPHPGGDRRALEPARAHHRVRARHEPRASRRAARGDAPQRTPRCCGASCSRATWSAACSTPTRTRATTCSARTARITFLDFGCVQPISGRALAERAHVASRRAPARRARVHRGVSCRCSRRAAANTRRDRRAYVRSCFEPLFASPVPASRGHT